MPQPPQPSTALLRRMTRAALSRGVPPEDAEDIVVASWEQAAAKWDPKRGDFAPFAVRIVQRKSIDFWRRRATHPERPASPHLALVASESPSTQLEQVAANQRRLLQALTPQDRKVFKVWALQKHLPQGRLDARKAADMLGITVSTFNNAKRRLRTRILGLAAEWGLAPRAFFSVQDDEGPRKGVQHVG